MAGRAKSADEKYMRQALTQAKKAAAIDEVPIGCVIVRHEMQPDGTLHDRVIARGYNRRNTDKNVLSHAELIALKKATRVTGDWRLEDCTMYVTLEPCQMCAGAIVQSRMKRVVVASMNPKAGCAGSILNLLQMAQFNHQVELTTGVLDEECSRMLSDFFRNLRLKKKEEEKRRKNMKFDVILWDIDGTLLNFLAAEKEALRACFKSHDMGECTDEMIARYSTINRRYWEALERGEISKDEVLVGRYREFFAQEGLDVGKAESFNAEYQVRLGDTIVFCDDGYELVKKFRPYVKQYAVTNGTKVAQDRKLKNSGLDQLLDDFFISDVIGAEKPTPEFFAPVLEKLAGIPKDRVLLVGDSLTSDIRGGNNAGFVTCWYNPRGAVNDKGVRVDYEIRDLHEVAQIVGLS